MGQYYKAVFLSNNSKVIGWTESNGGLKMMEHAFHDEPVVEFIQEQIYNKPSKIVWAGDYEDEIITVHTHDNKEYKTNHYGLVSNNGNSLSNLITKIGANYKYIINWDKKEYVDKTKCPPNNSNGWQANPLSLLTCTDPDAFNQGQNEYTGSWMKNSISISDKFPKSFKEIFPNFVETR
jgi:hypothetical protein